MSIQLLERVVEAFAAEKVKYALVGGFAVALHGAVRGTMDIDCILRHSQANFEACERALRSIGLVPRLPLKPQEVFHFREEYISKRNLIAWSFINPKMPLEVVDVIITHDLARSVAVPRNYGLQKVPVLALEELIAMKRSSGRPQDLEDVKLLEALRVQS